MEDFFVIVHNKIDNAWNPPDGSLEIFIWDYCEEVLDIPFELLLDIFYTKEGIEISLNGVNEEIIGEDWYINLCRLSYFSKTN